MGLQVLFNKHGLVIVSKPVGVCSDAHPEDRRPSIETQIGLLSRDLRILHRIDKNTSGILAVGDTTTSMGKTSTYWWIRGNWHQKVTKQYLAITKMPGWLANSCDKKLQDEPGEPFKACRTEFKLLQGGPNGLALLLCTLADGGKKHQIRKHATEEGIPLLGDQLYGGEATPLRSGQMLHAWRMALNLPTGRVEVQASVPDDFRRLEFDWGWIDKGANKVITIE